MRPAKKVKAGDSGGNPGKPPPSAALGRAASWPGLTWGSSLLLLKFLFVPSGKKYTLTEKLVFLSCFKQINLDGRKRVHTWGGVGGGDEEMDESQQNRPNQGKNGLSLRRQKTALPQCHLVLLRSPFPSSKCFNELATGSLSNHGCYFEIFNRLYRNDTDATEKKKKKRGLQMSSPKRETGQ